MLSPGRDRRAWPWLAVAATAIVVGAWLRLYQLRDQMLLDDEWHAVRMLIHSDALGILTHFGFADHSIPLTLYYRWLYDLGVLSEWQMHLPPVIAGLAFLVVAPMLTRDVTSWPVRAIWIALLAISPILVYLSRTARPYALTCLFAFVAIVTFRRWRHEHSLRWATAYFLSAALAAWLHLISIVFTLWPFVFFGVPLLRDALRGASRADAARELGRFVALAAVTVLVLAALIGPPLASDWAAMAGKAGENSVTAVTLYRSLILAFGVISPILIVALVALVAFGFVCFWQRDREFAAYIGTMLLAGCGAIVLARPAWIQHQLTFVRYSLPVLPFVLLFLAEGLTAAIAAARPPVPAGIALAAVAGLGFAGPLSGYYYAPNQFMGHGLFQVDYEARTNPYATLPHSAPMPRFYQELATRPPGSITLIEAPGRPISNYVPDAWYQAIHRQNVKYALVAPVCGGDADEYPANATGARFRRIAKLADLLDGATWGGDLLVLRLKPWTIPSDIGAPWPDMAACRAKVAARLGEPVYRDDQIEVFALKSAAPHATSSTSR